MEKLKKIAVILNLFQNLAGDYRMHRQPTANTPRSPSRPLGRVCAAVAASLLASLFASTPVSAARVTDNSLISYWPIDETAGITINDTVGVTRANMTIYPNGGSYTWLPAEGAIRLDNAVVNIGSTGGSGGKIFNALTGANAFTVEVWFTPITTNTNGQMQIIFGYGCHNATADNNCSGNPATADRYISNLFIAQRDNAITAAFMSTGWTGGNSGIPPDPDLTWVNVLAENVATHAVITWDGNTGEKRIEVHRTGLAPRSTSSTRSGLNIGNWTTRPVGIADPDNAAQGQFGGKTLLVAIYNRALTPTEILQNYNTSPYPPCLDQDLDGYGNPGSAECARLNGPGYDQLDCNDDDDESFPGNPEICDNKDNNCAGGVDDNLGSSTCGTGACQRTVQQCVAGVPQTCTPGTGRAETCANRGTDDDCEGTIDNNLGPELCDGLDNNCLNGLTDDGTDDADIRNRATCTPCLCGTCVWQCSATTRRKECVSITGSSREQCNGKDDNCDGDIDEGCRVYYNRQDWAREPANFDLIFCRLAQ